MGPFRKNAEVATVPLRGMPWARSGIRQKENAVKAIDVHAHLNTTEMMNGCLGKYNEAMQKYYKFDLQTKTPAEMAQDFIKPM